MTTTNVQCPINGCQFSTGETSEAIAVALLNTHAISHTRLQPTVVPARQLRPKLDRDLKLTWACLWNSGICLRDDMECVSIWIKY